MNEQMRIRIARYRLRALAFVLVFGAIGYIIGLAADFDREPLEVIRHEVHYIPVYIYAESEKKGTSDASDAPQLINIGDFRITAYCSCEKCCGKWAHDRPKDENGMDIVYGATGERLTAGISVAVDPSVIPYGTHLFIDGREYVAQDCGGAIKGNCIDVYFDDHDSAKKFGVRYESVYVKKKEMAR